MHISAARAAGLALLSLAVSQAAVSREPIACTDLAAQYPEEAVYDGVGNENDAASFSCQKLD